MDMEEEYLQIKRQTMTAIRWLSFLAIAELVFGALGSLYLGIQFGGMSIGEDNLTVPLSLTAALIFLLVQITLAVLLYDGVEKRDLSKTKLWVAAWSLILGIVFIALSWGENEKWLTTTHPGILYTIFGAWVLRCISVFYVSSEAKEFLFLDFIESGESLVRLIEEVVQKAEARRRMNVNANAGAA